jgi:CBS domain-containing protein
MQCPVCNHPNLPGANECEGCQSSLTQNDVPQATTPIELSLMEESIECLRPAEAISVSGDTPVMAAIEIMREKRIGCLLVTDEEGRLSGILTERDLLHKVAGEPHDLSRCTVARFMTPKPEALQPDQLLASALHHMMVGDYRHLPLTDNDGRPVGIISSHDIISFIESRFHQ